MSDLTKIQQDLSVPKNQRNNFGKYNYRSCEDILEALKKPLAENNCYLTISDEIELVGDRYYVKATATLCNKEGRVAASTGMAREALSKKGMDESQITGAASSYARKSALNGLFAIDDNKDADTDEHANTVSHEPVDLSPYIRMIAGCKEIDDLVECWKKIAVDFKGTQYIAELAECKDLKKNELMGVN